MSVSSDPQHFFQSDQSLEKAKRRSKKKRELKTAGDPISLPTKLLAVEPDTSSPSHVFVAEAGNVARRINIQDPKALHRVYRGHTAPVTSLTLNTDASVLYTGSWDKSVLAFSTSTKEVLRKFTAHTDFVKAVLYIELPTTPLLVSASADSSIIIWNPNTGERLHVLKSHDRGVQALAVDPVESDVKLGRVVMYSAGSKREIKRWVIDCPEGGGVKVTEVCEILQHETGVNSIRFLGEEGEEQDMWTASSDMTVKRFERSALRKLGDDSSSGDIDPDTELWHADFVNDVAMSRDGRWILTACSDEDVRVWDSGSSKLYHTFSGHYDVVTALAVVGDELISVSLDATVRKWSLKPADVKAAIEEAKKAGQGVTGEADTAAIGRNRSNSMLTEEEERELAELMGDDQD